MVIGLISLIFVSCISFKFTTTWTHPMNQKYIGRLHVNDGGKIPFMELDGKLVVETIRLNEKSSQKINFILDTGIYGNFLRKEIGLIAKPEIVNDNILDSHFPNGDFVTYGDLSLNENILSGSHFLHTDFSRSRIPGAGNLNQNFSGILSGKIFNELPVLFSFKDKEFSILDQNIWPEYLQIKFVKIDERMKLAGRFVAPISWPDSEIDTFVDTGADSGFISLAVAQDFAKKDPDNWVKVEDKWQGTALWGQVTLMVNGIKFKNYLLNTQQFSTTERTIGLDVMKYFNWYFSHDRTVMAIETITNKTEIDLAQNRDTIGFGYEKVGTDYVVVAIFKKMTGESFLPGLKIGDRIVSINGRPSHLTNLGVQGKYRLEIEGSNGKIFLEAERRIIFSNQN